MSEQLQNQNIQSTEWSEPTLHASAESGIITEMPPEIAALGSAAIEAQGPVFEEPTVRHLSVRDESLNRRVKIHVVRGAQGK